MEEIGDWLFNADFLVLPLIGSGTVSKTIPAKFQAYLAASRPIVALATGTVAEMVRSLGLGFVGAPGDVQSMVSAFYAAGNSSRDERELMGSRAKAILGNDFNRDSLLMKIESEILGNAHENS
jgi:glycosyltransferase involved in cell wall biosynthesis